MPLWDCMTKHTYRQLKVWIHWLDEQWNAPDLVCYYLMQLTTIVGGLFSGRKRPKILDFILKFRPNRKKVSEGQAAKNDAIWLASMGPVHKVYKDE